MVRNKNFLYTVNFFFFKYKSVSDRLSCRQSTTDFSLLTLGKTKIHHQTDSLFYLKFLFFPILMYKKILKNYTLVVARNKHLIVQVSHRYIVLVIWFNEQVYRRIIIIFTITRWFTVKLNFFFFNL